MIFNKLIREKSTFKNLGKKIPGIFYVLFPLIFLSVSCSNEKIIKEEKFIKIYTDLVIAKDTTNVNPDKLKPIIFKRYNINSSEYENTLKYYNQDPQRWDNFFKKTINYINDLRKKSP